jgi:hypothetical protein
MDDGLVNGILDRFINELHDAAWMVDLDNVYNMLLDKLYEEIARTQPQIPSKDPEDADYDMEMYPHLHTCRG